MLPIVTRPQSRTVKLKFAKKLSLSAEHLPPFLPTRHVVSLPITQGDVAPVVDAEGWLDHDVFAHVSQQLFQFDHSVCVEGFEGRVGVVGEGVVEFVAPAAGLEADARELGDEGVVAGGCRWISWSRLEVCAMFGTHSMPEIIFSYSSPVGVWLKVRARAMTSGSFCWAAMFLSCLVGYLPSGLLSESKLFVLRSAQVLQCKLSVSHHAVSEQDIYSGEMGRAEK